MCRAERPSKLSCTPRCACATAGTAVRGRARAAPGCCRAAVKSVYIANFRRARSVKATEAIALAKGLVANHHITSVDLRFVVSRPVALAFVLEGAATLHAASIRTSPVAATT